MLRLLVFIGFLYVNTSYAESYTVLSYHGANPPYSYFEGDIMKGIFPDIFARISELSGHQFTFVTFSVARGLRLFDQGKVDIEPGINPIWRSHTKVPGIYSEFYASSREIVVASQYRQERTPLDLYHKVLGVVRGYRYGEFEQHFAPGKIVKVDSRSEVELLAQIEHGNIDYAILGEASALFYINKNKRTSFKPVLLVSDLPVAMRLQPHLRVLRSELNKILDDMKQRGEIDTIYAKYGAKP